MARNQIKFSGEINEMSAAYFCREMDAMPARSSATIYLHTPGGDVYAGGEMINSFRAAMKRGCKFTLEIGSLCASMGAALLAAARASGCRAVAHSNSEAMFHGCWGIFVGGSDELTDQAKAMRDFNACVQRDLAKCGVTDTDDWFAADRMKFLNAAELKELGLVDSIVEDEADDADLKTDALQIAARLNHNQTKESTMRDKKSEEKPEEVTPEEDEKKETPPTAPEGEGEGEGEEPKTDPAPEAEGEGEEPLPEEKPDGEESEEEDEEETEKKVEALANSRFAKLQAKHDKMISDLTKERDSALKDLAAAKAEATSLNAEVEKLTADLAATRDQLAKGEQIRGAVVTEALRPDDIKDGWCAKWRSVRRSY